MSYAAGRAAGMMTNMLISWRLKKTGHPALTPEHIRHLKSQKYPWYYEFIYFVIVISGIFCLAVPIILVVYLLNLATINSFYLPFCVNQYAGYLIGAVLSPVPLAAFFLTVIYIVLHYSPELFKDFFLVTYNVKAHLPYPLEVHYLITRKVVLPYIIFLLLLGIGLILSCNLLNL